MMGKTNSINGAVAGKVGNLVFYSTPASSGMIIRTRPQMRTHARKHHVDFERTRQQNSEFKGCVKAAQAVIASVARVKMLGDYNSFGDVVRICKFIQQVSQEPMGKRSVLFSKAASLLNGFSFNKNSPFESLFRPPLSVSMNRQQGNISVIIPAMRPTLHLINTKQLSFFRFVSCLGCIGDLVFDEERKSYVSLNDKYASCSMHSPWHHYNEQFPETMLQLAVQNWEEAAYLTLLTGIGIEFGRKMPGGEIEGVKYAGAGKTWSAV